MNYLLRLIFLTLGILIANIVIAASLSSEAQERGISATCSSYLGQLEESYDLNGLNITFAHLGDPSIYTYQLKNTTMEALSFLRLYHRMVNSVMFQLYM